MYQVRKFKPTDDEYAALVAFLDATHPDLPRHEVAILRHEDKEWPNDYFCQRFVVEVVGRNSVHLIASGACLEPYWQYQAGTYVIEFDIHPDYGGQEIETLLYEQLLVVPVGCGPVPNKIVTRTREDQVERVKFLATQGFEPTMRSPGSSLKLASFDATPLTGIEEKVAALGVKIYTLRELYALEPEWKEKLYELRWAIVQDVPEPEPPTKWPMEMFEQIILDDPALTPDVWFVAVDERKPPPSGTGPWIGMSNIWVNDKTYERLDVGLTGTMRAWRRKGIATALKLRTIAYAQQHNTKSIGTSNEENNPMYHLNLKLGFQPKPATIHYEKKL